MWTGWGNGFNIKFGYWFVAIRRKRKGEVKRPLVDLKFGKSQQRESRMRKSIAYKRGYQEGARSVFTQWISEESCYYLIEDLLKYYDLEYIHDMVRIKKSPDVDPNG